MRSKHFRPLIFFVFCLFGLGACFGAGSPNVAFNPGANVSELVMDDFEVLAVHDVSSSMDISLFSGPLTPAERESFMPGGAAPASVNVFLLKMYGRNILFDTGWGKDGRARGGMLELLAEQGVAPEDIDYILLTHMHGDHAYGLLENGEAVFPRAMVMASAAEGLFWLSDGAWDDSNTRSGAELAVSISRAYDRRFTLFEFGIDVLPGITTMDAGGHTPGHAAFLVGNGKQRLLVAGDFVHAAALQFPNPDECARYDMNREAAVASRRTLMELASKNGHILAGMHIPFSGMGTVSGGEGRGYVFTPLDKAREALD